MRAFSSNNTSLCSLYCMGNELQ